MSKWGNVYWPLFLSVVSVLFIVPEVIALISNHYNDLSQYCWRELNVTKAWSFDRHTAAWWLSLTGWFLAAIVLTFHIWFKAE